MKEIILSTEDIQAICKEIAGKLEEKFKNNETAPIFIGVLNGATPFFMDLLKYYHGVCKIDFMQASSYSGTNSTGVIHLSKDISEDIKNKDVVLIEDVVDTGLTINYLKQYIQIKYQPRSISVVCLVDKKALRRVDFNVDYYGYTLRDNKFLIGYGLDYKGLARNYNYIFVPDVEEIEYWDKMSK